MGVELASFAVAPTFISQNKCFQVLCLLAAARLIVKTSGRSNPLSALHLYWPKSALLFSSTLTLLVLRDSCFIWEPSGLIHVIFGRGTPSVTHTSSTVWPIHEKPSVEELALSICALSVFTAKENPSRYIIYINCKLFYGITPILRGFNLKTIRCKHREHVIQTYIALWPVPPLYRLLSHGCQLYTYTFQHQLCCFF